MIDDAPAATLVVEPESGRARKYELRDGALVLSEWTGCAWREVGTEPAEWSLSLTVDAGDLVEAE